MIRFRVAEIYNSTPTYFCNYEMNRGRSVIIPRKFYGSVKPVKTDKTKNLKLGILLQDVVHVDKYRYGGLVNQMTIKGGRVSIARQALLVYDCDSDQIDFKKKPYIGMKLYVKKHGILTSKKKNKRRYAGYITSIDKDGFVAIQVDFQSCLK